MAEKKHRNIRPGKIGLKTKDRSHQLVKSILEVAPFGVYIVNKKGAIEYANAVMLAISGDTDSQFKSVNVFELPTYKELGLDKKIMGVFKGIPFLLEGVRYLSYYSKKTTIRNFVGIPFEERNEKKALIFVEDITKIKQAEEKMKEAMELRTQFTSMVSHELRTPLAAIKAAIELVLSQQIGSLVKRQRDILEVSKRNVDRLARLINSVLDFQKLDSGRMEFRMEKNSINKLIADVTKQMVPVMKERGIELRESLGADIPTITFDKDKITQVLVNLINNAMKFTQKGTISVSSSKLKNAVCVSVTDTGIGVKKEDLGKLFKSFSQIPHEEIKVSGGTGLGLAISKKIIQEHRGKMRVHSEYGKGSKFSFFLPVLP